ncbi:MAG: hypothetical protein CM15mP18_1230 [Methanobacteriota archaeon]|nr:MAG: hypothetical protein CM15mP18_1230 [Euryarchaeota archaeon]
MITAGIIFVLAESGSKFYKGFDVVQTISPPQDWSEDVKVSIKQGAIYDDGKLSDPLWLNRFCIVDWDMNATIELSDPLYFHLWLGRGLRDAFGRCR